MGGGVGGRVDGVVDGVVDEGVDGRVDGVVGGGISGGVGGGVCEEPFCSLFSFSRCSPRKQPPTTSTAAAPTPYELPTCFATSCRTSRFTRFFTSRFSRPSSSQPALHQHSRCSAHEILLKIKKTLKSFLAS